MIVGLPAQDNIPLNIPAIADKELDIIRDIQICQHLPEGLLKYWPRE